MHAVLSHTLHGSAMNITCSTPTINFWGKGPPFRASVGLMCSLSAIGSLLIIVSYVFFKSLRSRARLILVNLSLMDLGVSLTNLLGNFIYFDRFYFHRYTMPSNLTDLLAETDTTTSCLTFRIPDDKVINNLCIAQAFFAHYFTQASILWNINLAVFLYCLIVHHRTPLAKYILVASYFISYGLPVLVCVWLLATKRFGYSPSNTGWCSILIITADSDRPDVYAAAFGYDLWIYLCMILVPLLYVTVQLYVKDKLKQTKLYLHDAENRFWEAVHILDYQFLLIPVTFALLRIWTCVIDMIFVYVQYYDIPLSLNIALIYLAGIGDSGQGFANAILFVVFTKRVRRTLFNLKYWRLKICGSKEEYQLLIDSEIESVCNHASKTRTKNHHQESVRSDLFTPNAKPSFSESLRSTGALQGGNIN